ncbi:sensor histidine kinase [Streptomyces sp. NL15-2K]|uniref:sensor histidine kinase n=1 Tax=Streptomyces sp. NL15-2K TaxID=376149 RepID=UPI0035B53E6D
MDAVGRGSGPGRRGRHTARLPSRSRPARRTRCRARRVDRQRVRSHPPQGTGFRVTVRTAGDIAELLVEDEGLGFSDGGVGPHPTARGTSGAGSTGLGLDIARRTAEEPGGTFTAESAPGAKVTLSFPRAAD